MRHATLAFVLVSITLAVGAEAPFVAVVRGVVLCGLPGDRTRTGQKGDIDRLREQWQSHFQIVLRDGDYELPRTGSVPTYPLITALVVGPSQEIAAPVGGPVIERTVQSSPGRPTRYFFLFYQDFQASGERYSVVIQFPVFEVFAGTPLQTVKRFEQTAQPTHTVSNPSWGTLLCDLCGLRALPLAHVVAQASDGTTVEFRVRMRRPLVPFGTEPAQVVRGRVTLANATAEVTRYWDLAYSSEYHNSDERFGAALVPPIGPARYATVCENRNENTLLPEPYLQFLSENWTPLVTLSATRYEITLLPDADGDGVPDETEVFQPPPGRSNTWLPDSDGDGLPDGFEDRDFNGQRDPGETGTRNADSDGDRVEDGVEYWLLNSDPLHPSQPGTHTDQDRDGLPLPWDANDTNPDQDNDRYRDGYEAGVLDREAVVRADLVPTLGDVNGDGGVTNLDALLAAAIHVLLASPADQQAHNADPTRDGHITNLDALLIQSFFLRTWPLLPL